MIYISLIQLLAGGNPRVALLVQYDGQCFEYCTSRLLNSKLDLNSRYVLNLFPPSPVRLLFVERLLNHT